MSMTSHINSLISSVNYHLRNIRHISTFLDQDSKHAVVRSFILSRLDYGNALLYGAKSKDLDRLQSLQHKAIKLIFSANRLDSPAPLMNTLHWLPVRERINFKMHVCLQMHSRKRTKVLIWFHLAQTQTCNRSYHKIIKWPYTYCCSCWTKLYRRQILLCHCTSSMECPP